MGKKDSEKVLGVWEHIQRRVSRTEQAPMPRGGERWKEMGSSKSGSRSGGGERDQSFRSTGGRRRSWTEE